MMLQGIVHDADRMDTIVRLLVDAARVVGGTLELFREQVDLADLVASIAEAQRRDPDHPLDRVERRSRRRASLDPARLKTAVLAFTESLVWWAREGPIAGRRERAPGDVLHLWPSRAGRRAGRGGAPRRCSCPAGPGEGAGSKIGLFVTRGVVEAQGGRAWADVGDGELSFHLELPIPS